MVNPALQVINEDTWRMAIDHAIRIGDYEKLNQLKQIADLVQPNGTMSRTMHIGVGHMVANYVGAGFEIQVAQERWDVTAFSSKPVDESHHLVVINLRKQEDNPNCEIITLREPFSKFPSPEMRAKLELLRYK